MELVDLLKVEFDKIADQFAKIDERFEKIDQRFLDLEQKMDSRFNKIEQRLDYHGTWLKRIDTTINNNLVQKKDFNTLIKILENHSLISSSEAHHFVVSPR